MAQDYAVASRYISGDTVNLEPTANYVWSTVDLAWVKQTQATSSGAPASDVNVLNFPATQPVSIAATVAVSGPLTDTQLRAVAVPVSGPVTDAQLRASAVPVSGPVTDAQLRATPVPVSNASLPLPTGAATSANQVTELASLASIDGKLANPLPVTGPLTDTQLRASAVPVSGPLTDTQLRATAVPVSGPLTDTQLRATAVPVSSASLPLPANAAQETGGNLAAIFAALGTNSVDVAAASTMLNLLAQLGKKVDGTTKAVTALAPPPKPASRGSTLLHRS